MNQSNTDNNKRIAKNSALLYLRMILIMGVTLYTSRVVLNTLGIEDYGLYNVVGGVVAMLSFMNGSLSGSSSRFITFALGGGKREELCQTFSTIMFIHILLALLIFILAETVGLWFVYNKLVIPDNRMEAALWVYHCSILSTIVSLLSVPYNSLIIAHERMSAFAYISIVEVVMKLLIVYLLMYLPVDKLAVYAVLVLSVQILIRIIYNSYCIRHFSESKEKPHYYPIIFKKITVYSGWTMNGYLAIIGYTQGINILLNLFFGPVVNAARGIAVQVQSAVSQFVLGFQTAVKPQIIKSYAVEDFAHMHQLIIALSKYGVYLMLLIVFPLFICINPILQIWLGVVPDHTANFVRIMFVIALIEPLRGAMISGIHASGNIKKFQIWEGSVLLSVVPIAYVLLKCFHISPESVFLVYLFVEFVAQIIRMLIVLPQIKMDMKYYLKEALIPLLLPLLVLIVPAYYIFIPSSVSISNLILSIIISFLYVAIILLFIGLNKKERHKIYSIIWRIK